MTEAARPLREMEHDGRRVGILVWPEGTTWRSAWRVETGAWHSLRGHGDTEEEMADAALQAALEHLGSDGARPARRPRRAGSETEGAARSTRASPAPTARSWTELHQEWMRADAAVQDMRRELAEASRQRLPAGNSAATRSELARLQALETQAEEARRAMDRHLSRILRPQRRRSPTPPPASADDASKAD
jgi:hypothetical protein